jgi:transposase-like protein
MLDHKKKGRRYDAQFKADAVALVRQGQPKTKVAADLGLSPHALQRWLDQAAAGQPRPGAAIPIVLSPEQLELARLRRELQEISLQRDILKKALAICSASALPLPAMKS